MRIMPDYNDPYTVPCYRRQNPVGSRTQFGAPRKVPKDRRARERARGKYSEFACSEARSPENPVTKAIQTFRITREARPRSLPCRRRP